MEPTEQRAPCSVLVGAACRSCLRFALLVFVAYSVVLTAYRVRDEPRELAFVAGAYALLAALVLCLRRAERLTPESPAGERRRVQAAVWVLSTVLSLAFAYRVAALMPPALAALVWCMTAAVVFAGLYMLVLCKDPRYGSLDDAGDSKPVGLWKEKDQCYQALDDINNCDAAAGGHGKAIKNITCTAEIV